MNIPILISAMFIGPLRYLRSIAVFLFSFFLSLFVILSTAVVAEREDISAALPGGQTIHLYKDYRALVVGVGNYDKWPSLPNAVQDARDVSWLLKRFGFEVTLVTDPNSRELKKALDDFVQEAGQEPDRGVVFYYRGNGETRTPAGGPKLGWIIPRDCPLARDDPKGFAAKAISTKVIESYSEQIKSKHVLMLFDSSLPGEVFSLQQPVLKMISDKTVLAVRQYIIAGGEDEPVPNRSEFKRYLFKGLQGEADFIHDGYITGSELGVYLLDRVVKETGGRQHTQYGKIKNPALALGDFVFDRPGAELDIARLFVKTDPGDATVRILNIVPRFHQGIELDAGSYHVEVSAKGHETTKQWVKLEAGEDKTINIRLSKLGEEGKEKPIVRPPGQILDSFTSSVGMEFVGIAPGTFVMGTPGGVITGINDEKGHQVTLTKKFYMETTEVTIGHFRQFVEATGHKTDAETGGGCYVPKGGRWEKKRGSNWKNPGVDEAPGSHTDDYPVTCVTWRDVQAFISWLSRLDGKRFGLPTEAEWEYAARAGKDTPFAFGRCLSTDQANFGGPGQRFSDCKGAYRVNRNGPIKVGSLAPSPWKLFDMNGNVSEWVQDWYGPYPDGPVTDPKGPPSGTERVIRGGYWSTDANGCRSAKRERFLPKIPSNAIGFRLVMRP